MLVHFVCSGNTFRSRLAEAYLKSLEIPSIEVMSSGARAKFDKNQRITPYAALILKKYHLEQYASKDKTQLTQSRLDMADITICINRAVYHECLEAGFKLPMRTYIWDVPDIKKLTETIKEELADHEVPPFAQYSFNKIRNHVDELIAYLKSPRPKELIDVLDENGNPTGRVSDIRTIHAMGLVHTGAHIGLYNKNGQIVMERRSSSIIFNPGLWDISMGGVVASGETPDQTIIRETQEELGINLDTSKLKKIFVCHSNHYLPHYGFHNNNYTHTFIAEIPVSTKFILQKSEVAEAKFFDMTDVKHMIDSKKTSIDIIRARDYHHRILSAISRELRHS